MTLSHCCQLIGFDWLVFVCECFANTNKPKHLVVVYLLYLCILNVTERLQIAFGDIAVAMPSNNKWTVNPNNLVFGGQGKWFHVALTVDYSSYKVGFYVNGNLSWSGNGTAMPIITQTQVFLGRGGNNGASFLGYVRQFLMYPVALSAAQVMRVAQITTLWCAAGMYTNNSNVPRCSNCSTGSYAPISGHTACVACPIGTYAPRTGLIQCLPCPAGFACDQVGLSAATQPCQAGFFCSTGSQATTGIVAQPTFMLCFQDSVGAQTASISDLGPNRGLVGTVAACAKTCLAFSSNSSVFAVQADTTTSQLNCFCGSGGYPCRLNQYPSCQYSWSGSGTNFCNTQLGRSGTPWISAVYQMPNETQACFYPGYYCPQGTVHPFQFACPAGSFCLAGVTAPTPCPPGSFCATTNVAPVACAIGRYSNASATVCSPCAQGTFSDASGMAACTQCPNGFYAAFSGMTVCVQCATGSFCNAVSTRLCNIGFFSANGAQTSCAICAPGNYASQLGQTTCQKCPVGFFCPQRNCPSEQGCGTRTHLFFFKIFCA